MDTQTYFRKELLPINTELSVKLVTKQSVVSVLCIDATAYIVSYECANGEVLLNGRCNYRLVVLDAEGNTSGLNYNADFAEKIIDQSITTDCKLSFCCSVDECSTQIEGSIIEINTVLSCQPYACASQSLQIVQEQEGVIVQKSSVNLCTYAQNIDFPINIVEQITTKQPINSVINAKSCIISGDSQYNNGVLTVEGECSVELLYSMGEDNTLCGEIIAFPYKEEVEIVLQGAITSICCSKVKNTKVRIDVVEQQENTSVTVEIVAELGVINCSVENVEFIGDAYSLLNQVMLVKQGVLTTLPVCNRTFEFDISYYHEFDSDVGDVVTCICSNLDILRTVKQSEQLTLEGILRVDLLCQSEQLNTIQVEVPFTKTINENCISQNVQLNLDYCLTSLSIRQDRRGVDINAQVTGTACVFATVEQPITVGIEVGEPIQNNEWAFEVVNALAGDYLWTVAKNLNMREEDITTLNPNLVFPLEQDEQIVIYHKL